MDLTTKYLGMTLRTPLVPSASPLSEEIDTIKRLEDAGASAVVLHSLFEEQLSRDRLELHHHLTHTAESYAEAQTFFPEPSEFKLGPEEYLEHIHKAKRSVDIPIIASLNGSSVGGWTSYALKMQEAGADAIELNVYYIPTQMDVPAAAVEETYLDILRAVRTAVRIPVAIKLSPFFSSMAHMARRLDEAGADALVLFNRFYQPDIDLESLEVRPNVILSTPQAMRLPLRWVAILHGRIKADLAATGGIHTATDVLKMLMAGASITMLCSALLRHGVDHLKTVEREMVAWMADNEYDSVVQMQGSMSQMHCADPSAFERAQYMRALQTYKPDA